MWSHTVQCITALQGKKTTCQSNLINQHLFTAFRSVTQPCLTLCNPMDCNTPVFPVHHQLLEPTQTHVHCVSDAIQPSHCLVPFPSHLQSFPASGSFSLWHPLSPFSSFLLMLSTSNLLSLFHKRHGFSFLWRFSVICFIHVCINTLAT